MFLACALVTGFERSHAGDDVSYRGRRLVKVLKEFQDGGLELIFSSAVVDGKLRVTVEPEATEPRAVLDEILPPLGLRAQPGPAGSILIVPGGSTPTGEAKAEPVLPRSTFITEVVVTPSQRSVVRQEQPPTHIVSGEEAVLAPSIGGDITRVIELLPGVTAPDNSAAFNVRGSLASDVSLVLDGLELYDPFHLQSFASPFSLIDTNVVDRIEFFGGGFTADLGDRHGGFVEISTLAPADAGSGEIELGTLNSRMSFRSPTSQGAGSWLVSARAWYPEALLDTTELGQGEDLDPRFADVYAKAAINVAGRHRLSAHGLLAYDRLAFQETGEDVNESVDALTRNGYAWVQATSAWSPDLTSETILSGGHIERRRDGVSSVDGPLVVADDRVVRFMGFKHDSVWRLSDAHALKVGADARRLDATYRYSNVEGGDPSSAESIRLDPDGTSFGLYVAHRARLWPGLATEVGARWDRQTYTDDNQLSPRFNAVWRPDRRSELRVALGRFHQSQRIHELHVEDGETEFGRSEVSEQAELSFRHRFRRGIRVRFDLYYRKLSDLRPRYENLFEPIEFFPETNDDRVLVEPEGARLRGAEVLVRRATERPLFWWVSYTLSAADDIIGGEEVPRSWDQTHAGKFLVGYHREDRWSVSISGSAHTGWPTTPVLDEDTVGDRNSERLSAYFRLDAKARRAFSLSRGRLWLTLEVVNLTDRENPCCLDEVLFEDQPDGSVDVRPKYDHWLGITPSFNVLWEF